jgi:hypothetical protein
MKTLVLALITLASGLAMAAAETSTTSMSTALTGQKLLLTEGHWQVGGGFGWSTTKMKYSDSNLQTFALAPQLEYFAMDNLSVGGTLRYYSYTGGGSTSTSSVGIGPSATYYFHQDGNTAFYGAQGVTFTKYSDDSKTYSVGVTTLGAKYFFAPQAAFGVGLSHSYALSSDQSFQNETALIGNFSFYY